MKTKVFIDGHSGTTGLRIYERLAERQDIEVLQISEALRKEPSEVKKYMAAADIAFLCLPDQALSAWQRKPRCASLIRPRPIGPHRTGSMVFPNYLRHRHSASPKVTV